MSLSHDGPETVCRFEAIPGMDNYLLRSPRQAMETMAAGVACTVATLTTERITPREVCFRHAAPPKVTVSRQLLQVLAKRLQGGAPPLGEVTFPDYHLELVEAFGDGDRLVARIHTKATMLGPMNIDGAEIPPTGKVFEQDWVAVLTFDGDQISAIDEFHDNYGILIQLGLAQ